MDYTAYCYLFTFLKFSVRKEIFTHFAAAFSSLFVHYVEMVLPGMRSKKWLPWSARQEKSFHELFTAATVVKHAHSWNREGGRWWRQSSVHRLHPYYEPRLQELRFVRANDFWVNSWEVNGTQISPAFESRDLSSTRVGSLRTHPSCLRHPRVHAHLCNAITKTNRAFLFVSTCPLNAPKPACLNKNSGWLLDLQRDWLERNWKAE